MRFSQPTTCIGSLRREKSGAGQVYQEIVTMYRTAFPDIKLTIEEQVAEGDKVVTRTSGSGTHRAELFGTVPTGERVSGVPGIVVTRIANGKVVEDTWVYDALGMLRQLGVVPAAVAKVA
jgi:predicted ester cyclase